MLKQGYYNVKCYSGGKSPGEDLEREDLPGEDLLEEDSLGEDPLEEDSPEEDPGDDSWEGPRGRAKGKA